MKLSFSLWDFLTNFTVVAAVSAGIIFTHSTAVNAATEVTCEPFKRLNVSDANDEKKPYSVSQADPAQRAVTVRIEVRGKKVNVNGSGVIIARQSTENGSNEYIVLTVDHNFVNNAWKNYNILEPDYPPVIMTSDSEVPLPSDWKDAQVVLITCDGEEHPLKAENLIRLRRNFIRENQGVDLALVRFRPAKNDVLYPVAILADSFKLKLFSFSGVNGWPASLLGDTSNALNLHEAYTPGEIHAVRPNDDLGTPQKNGYVMFYDAITAGGMSGGPIFNQQGQVIGIHGQGDRRALNLDRVEPTKIDFTGVPLDLLPQLSGGIPISTLINQLTAIPATSPGNRSVIQHSALSKSPSNSVSLNPNFYFALPEELKNPEVLNIQAPNPDQQSNVNTLTNQHYQRGIALLERPINSQRAAQAVDELEKAVLIKKDSDTLYALGSAYHALSELDRKRVDPTDEVMVDKALENFREALKLEENAATHIAIAQVLYTKRRYRADLPSANELHKQAINHLTKAIELNQEAKEPLPYILRGILYFHLEDRKKAAEDWKEAEEIGSTRDSDEDKLKTYLLLAASRNGIDYVSAKKNWNHALNLSNRGSSKHKRMFAVSIRRYFSTLEQANNLLDELKKENPGNDQMYDQAKAAVATAYAERATGRLSPDPTRSQDPKDILTSLKTSLDDELGRNPEYRNNPNLFLSRAHARYALGDVSGAIDDFKQAREIYRSRPQPDELNVGRVNDQLCRISDYANSAESQGICSPQPEVKPKEPVVTAVNPPITRTFYCDPVSGRVTFDRTANGNRRLIQWVSNRFTPWGYDPEKRCQQVSARLQQYFPDGNVNVNQITYGRMNRRNVLCIANAANPNQCATNGLILTLEPGQNPVQMLKEFRQALSTNGLDRPLTKEVSKPESSDKREFSK